MWVRRSTRASRAIVCCLTGPFLAGSASNVSVAKKISAKILLNADLQHTIHVRVDVKAANLKTSGELDLLHSQDSATQNTFSHPNVIEPSTSMVDCHDVCLVSLPPDTVAVLPFIYKPLREYPVSERMHTTARCSLKLWPDHELGVKLADVRSLIYHFHVFSDQRA